MTYLSYHLNFSPLSPRTHTPLHTCTQHECKKQKKEDEEKRQRAVQLLKEKKAAEKLRERKAESERKQLEYKGLLVRSKLTVCCLICLVPTSA